MSFYKQLILKIQVFPDRFDKVLSFIFSMFFIEEMMELYGFKNL